VWAEAGVRTLVGASGPDDPDPARGFVADYSLTHPVPWLSEVRDDTVPLRWPTTSTASGGHLPLIYRTDRRPT
jgi:hypothetical protein